LQPDGAQRTVHDFIQRYQDIALDILAMLGDRLRAPAVPSRSTETAGAATATAKELFEKSLNPVPSKMEFGTILGTSAESALPAVPLALGWFQFSPSSSYFRRFSGSLRTSLASLISLNFFLGRGFVLGDGQGDICGPVCGRLS